MAGTIPIPRVPLHPELVPILAAITLPSPVTLEIAKMVNENPSILGMPLVETIIADLPVTHTERQIPGLEKGDPEITLSIFTPTGEAKGPRPCIYWLHGGGMIIKHRNFGISGPLSLSLPTDAVLVTVEYRVAPEVQGVKIIDDCYAGLVWISENAKELGVDLERIMMSGVSGGGGLAAGTAILARDRKGPKLCAQLLFCPMLDCRNITTSSKQFGTDGSWTRESNEVAWKAVLGDKYGKDDACHYVSPALCEDLSGLPPAYIDVGSAEIFRDECVAYATRMWSAGVQADLRVFGGGFHAYEGFAPTSRLAVQTTAARLDWVKDIFGST